MSTHASISTERMVEILRELAAQQERLSTCTPASFDQQVPRLNAAIAHLDEHFFQQPPQKLKKLLQEPMLLKHLMQLAAASLAQLSVQLDSNVQLTKTVATLCNTLERAISGVQERESTVGTPSTPADTANLKLMEDTGKHGI